MSRCTCFLLPEIQYLVHLQRFWQLVRDEQHGHLPLELVDGSGEMFGGLDVEVAYGFVKDEHARMLEQGAGDGDTLLLSAGEADTVFADRGLVALRQLFDDLMDLGHFAYMHDLFKAGMRVGELQIVVDGAGE